MIVPGYEPNPKTTGWTSLAQIQPEY